MDTHTRIVEALDCKLDAIRKTGIGKLFADKLVKFMAEEEKEALRKASVYSWDKSMIENVIKASQNFPMESKFNRVWLHQPLGFWYLGMDSPIKVPNFLGFRPGEMSRVHAILYYMRDDDPSRGTPFFSPRLDIKGKMQEPCCVIFGYSYDHHEQTPGLVPVATIIIGEEQTIASQIHEMHNAVKLTADGYSEAEDRFENAWKVANDQVLMLFAAGSLWMNQKIISLDVSKAPRHVKRRADRLKVNSTIQVVSLRARYNPNAQHSGSGQPVEWSCHWKVKGFWRNQWYPSLSKHVPIWIDEFVKGDLSKPMKVHPETVFNVNR